MTTSQERIGEALLNQFAEDPIYYPEGWQELPLSTRADMLEKARPELYPRSIGLSERSRELVSTDVKP